MPSSTFSFPSPDGTQVIAYRWDVAGEPRAAVQLTHGMGEHARRYDHVARALNEAGFTVYAQDHRGHGASADPGALGDLGRGSWPALVEDIGLLSARIRAEHPGLPLILLGHSMGSFAVQQYLLDHSEDVDGVVLTGTAAIDVLEPIDTESTKRMFAGSRRLADPADVAAMRSALPVYIAVGEADPVNGGLALLAQLTDRYAAAGLADVTVRTYPDARHEILNETNRAEVIAELTSWLDRVVAPSLDRG
ncbi:MAG: alpha/beta hydrolase [Streptosporangiaceae bacterium]